MSEPQPCPLGRDYIRSCYESDFVLEYGGPKRKGRWYFVNTPSPVESNYGSLTWWKDNADAVFPGIGEVFRYGWVDGSAQPCSSPTFTCLQCPSAELPGYGGVNFTPPVGGPFAMTHVSGDHWTYTWSYGGDTFDIELTCGSQSPGCTSFSIKDSHKNIIYQEPASLDHSTHTYKFHNYANVPGAWPLGDTYFQLLPGFTAPQIYAHCWKKGGLTTSLTGTWSVSLPSAMPVLYVIYQFGTDQSGGTLVDPPVSSGSSILLASGQHRLTLIYDPSAPAGTTFTVPTSAAADICWLSAFAISGTFSGVLDTNNVLVSQPTSLNPAISCSSPAVTPGIQGYAIMTWRSALSSATVPVPNTFTLMDANNGPDNANVVGGTPLFEGAGMCGGAQKYSSSPFTSATCHTSTTERWDAMFFNTH